jgi:uncharacterized OsmC-like protein
MALLQYHVTAQRTDGHGSVARTKGAHLTLDTDPAGRADAFNPAELFLAAIAACMLKGIERTMPMLKFKLRGAAVRLVGERQDRPPKMIRVQYELWVDTDEPDRRLNLLHDNLRKFGTIFNTVSAACPLEGTIHRGLPTWENVPLAEQSSGAPPHVEA